MERGAWQNTAWSHKESDLRKTGHVAYVCKTYLYDITQKTGLKNVYVCVCVYIILILKFLNIIYILTVLLGQ